MRQCSAALRSTRRSRVPRRASLSFVACLALVEGCGQKERQRAPYAEQACEENCGGGAGGGRPGRPENDAAASVDTRGTSSEQDTTEDVDAGRSSALLDPQVAVDLLGTRGASLGLEYVVYGWPNEDDERLRSSGQMPELVNVDWGGEWLLLSVVDANDVVDATWLPTLMWQLPASDAVVVPVFEAQFWSDLAASQVVSPTALDPEAAQVLLQISDSNGQPLSGVVAEVASGSVAYGSGGTASDALTNTDDTGVLVWLNAPVGEAETITLATDSDRWSVVLPTRPGTLTLAGHAR